MSDHDIVIRLLLAMLLGGLVGLEREAAGKAAGLRTHHLVCVGSALVMMTSIFLFETYKGQAEVDPSRLAAQVISGIGFLGAGTIIQSGANVKGLTTAASLWAVATVGLAVGCGFIKAASLVTVIMLVGLFVIGKIMHRFFPDSAV